MQLMTTTAALRGRNTCLLTGDNDDDGDDDGDDDNDDDNDDDGDDDGMDSDVG
jgi:hypothetical protein